MNWAILSLVRKNAKAEVAFCGLLFARIARVSHRRLADALEPLHLRPPEFGVLRHLAQSEGLSQQELGWVLRIDPSNLVGLLDGLEADGLVQRSRDPADRRRHLIELTAAGRRRLEQAADVVVEADRELLAPLGPAERRQLEALLDRLATHACGPGRGRGRGC
jgi:DNA-binding MarR family transcriptional regulator